jgi:hypothetical protein
MHCRIVSLALAPAHAQRTDRLDVWIIGDDCPGKEQPVVAIMDGDDRRPIRLEYKEPCHWTGIVREGAFSASRSRFSLRLGRARTECHAGEAKKAGPDAWVASFAFTCCSKEPVKVVRINATPSVNISYLREVFAVVPGKSRPDLRASPCVEKGTLDPYDRTIDHVQFGSERIYLQIGAREPDAEAISLRVKDLPLASKNGYESLTFDGVLHRLIVQGVDKGSLSPNAMDLNAVKLREVRLEKLEVWVTK